MKVTIGLILVVFCLTGCSEMQIIGNAAMREMHADSLRVNWASSAPVTIEKSRKIDTKLQLAAVKTKSFSSFRNNMADKDKKPIKGLWERHGS